MNCMEYLTTMKGKKLIMVSTSNMFMIKNYLILHIIVLRYWIPNMVFTFAIIYRRLNKGEVDLRVINGARVVALVMWTYYFTLSSGLILELDNCYFALVLSRSIISFSYVVLNRFEFIIEGKCCSFIIMVFFYGSGDYTNGLYILDFEGQYSI